MPHVKPKDKIPLYSVDNELHDWITPQRATRLEALGIVRVVRHKKGHVNRCIMHRRPSDPRPTPLSVYLGTRYSYLERWIAAALFGRCASFGKAKACQQLSYS